MSAIKFLITVALSLCLSTSAFAYTFTNVDDSTGPRTLYTYPALNDSGVVAFGAYFDTEGLGIFTGTPGDISTAATDEDAFSSFGYPTINNADTVAFWASLDSGHHGFYTHDGLLTTPIIETTGSAFSVGSSHASINDSGFAAFYATFDSGGYGVYKSDGSTLHPIATNSTFFSFPGEPYINAGGSVAFTGFNFDSGTHLYVGSGGPLTTIAGVAAEINSFDAFTMNIHGDVVFAATLDNSSRAIYIGDGTSLDFILSTSSSPFHHVEFPSINDSGSIAFSGTLDDTVTEGIYTGADPVLNKVIQIGDSLLGSTVTDLLFKGGLNNNGDIAFWYELANNISGVAIASPLPIFSLADFNSDGFVDGADFSFFLGQWGAPGGLGLADFNSDNTVDGADFSFFLGEWNPSPPGLAFVPEPATLFLTSLAGLVLLRRHRSSPFPPTS